jgi:hypothetical protein
VKFDSDHTVVFDGSLYQVAAPGYDPAITVTTSLTRRPAYRINITMAYAPQAFILIPADLLRGDDNSNHFFGRVWDDIVHFQQSWALQAFRWISRCPFSVKTETKESLQDVNFLDPRPVW